MTPSGRRARDEGRGRRGEQHLPAVAGGADPCGPVHVDPDVALLADDRLAGVDAHPHADVFAVGPVVRRERALGRDGRGDRVAGTLEGIEEGVALRVELAPAARVEGVTDDRAMGAERLRVAVVEPLEQLRRAFDVGEDEGDRAGVERAHALNRSASSASARRRRTRGFASLTISSR